MTGSLIFLVCLVAAIGFFSSSETAFLSLSRLKIRQMIRNKKPGARQLEKLHSDMDSLLTIVLIGINFLSTLASSVGTALAISIAGTGGVGLATAVITFFITIFGEIVPKTVAAQSPVKIARRNAVVLLVLQNVFRPVIWLFSALSRFVSGAVQCFWKSDDTLITEEELKTLIDVGTTEGTLENSEKTMLYRLFEFSDLLVHDIMKHRSFIKGIAADAASSEVVQMFLRTGYSRLAVFEDDGESICGILHYKAVLFSQEEEIAAPGFVRTNMQPALFVPESFTALELLRLFKKQENDIAVALNEQGGVAGLVTMADLLHAVFGRVMDEFSADETPPENRIKIVSADEFIVPGDMKLSDVNELLKLSLESDEYTTLGGWLLEKFDALPSAGEVVRDGSTCFVVEEQSRRRIVQVRIQLRRFLPTAQ